MRVAHKLIMSRIMEDQFLERMQDAFYVDSRHAKDNYPGGWTAVIVQVPDVKNKKLELHWSAEFEYPRRNVTLSVKRLVGQAKPETEDEAGSDMDLDGDKKDSPRRGSSRFAKIFNKISKYAAKIGVNDHENPPSSQEPAVEAEDVKEEEEEERDSHMSKENSESESDDIEFQNLRRGGNGDDPDSDDDGFLSQHSSKGGGAIMKPNPGGGAGKSSNAEEKKAEPGGGGSEKEQMAAGAIAGTEQSENILPKAEVAGESSAAGDEHVGKTTPVREGRKRRNKPSEKVVRNNAAKMVEIARDMKDMYVYLSNAWGSNGGGLVLYELESLIEL